MNFSKVNEKAFFLGIRKASPTHAIAEAMISAQICISGQPNGF